MKTPPRTIAVIDIGSAAIRMSVAQIGSRRSINVLEELKRHVHLGKDTFTSRKIGRQTIEECVDILRGFKQVMEEYGVTEAKQIRAVATSAVREATNRQDVLDRIYSATGIVVKTIDEAVVNRLNYLTVQRTIRNNKTRAKHTLAADIGAGSTNLLVLQKNNVVYSHSHNLGALRVLELLDSFREPTSHLRSILDNQLLEMMELMGHSIKLGRSIRLMALSSAVIFAGQEMGEPSLSPMTLNLSKFEKFTRRFLDLSVEERSEKYHISYAQAETFGPILLAYVLLAKRCGLTNIKAIDISLQEGLLLEAATEGIWTEGFKRQIVRSAIALGRKYDFNEAQARHIARLCKELFSALKPRFGLDPRFELILYIAALLHQIGTFISNQAHHKHSMYLIRNSNLFGLGKHDILLIGLIARYHRRAAPKPSHSDYQSLDRDERISVSQMAAILRIAVALESANRQRIRDFSCQVKENRLVITVNGIDDLSLELLGLKQRSGFFEDIFGLQIELRKST